MLSRSQLKALWITGFTPNQENFYELFDSLYNKVDSPAYTNLTTSGSGDKFLANDGNYKYAYFNIPAGDTPPDPNISKLWIDTLDQPTTSYGNKVVLIADGDGTKFLSNNGTYNTIDSSNVVFDNNTVYNSINSITNIITTYTNNPVSSYGGTTVRTNISSDVQLINTDSRLQFISSTTDSIVIKMPSSTTLGEGGPLFFINNYGIYNLIVKGYNNVTIGTIEPSKCGSMFLIDNNNNLWTMNISSSVHN